jgi:apolipoprotein N-acyltransferase
LNGAVTTPPARDRLVAALGRLGWAARGATAAVLGVAATLALPPHHATILLLPAFAGLALLVETARDGRRAFADGWIFGAAHFASGLYWIGHALLVDAARFGWMVPFAVGGLGAGLGLFAGLAALLARNLVARARIATPMALAASWFTAEWLRGHVLTGFPWNLAGTAWADVAPVAGLAAFVGLYGLTLLTVLAAACAADRNAIARGAAIALFAGLQAAHWLSPAPAGADPTAGDGPLLRLVQPDIPQSLKWDPRERQAHLQLTADLSLAPGAERIDHLLWPETATLFPLAAEAAFRNDLAQLVPPRGYLLTGSTRIERAPALRAWNSLHALDAAGEIRATYDKFHLVPFGEYVPLRGVLPLERIAVGPVDFSAGPGPRTIRLPGLPAFSPLICYESIFPLAARDPRDRPDWILIATNDAWFGASAGPYQHFVAARFRAIEEGLPVVRVANGGISAVIDAGGRVRAALALGARSHLDARLPPPLPPPPYARAGDVLPAALALALLLLGRVRSLFSAPRE